MSNQTNNRSSSAALWASAFILGALVIMQAGEITGPTAWAGESGSAGDYTLLTVNSGRGGDVDPDEVLFIIDNREQVLLVYEIENAQQKRITFRDGGSVAMLFSRARQ